MDRRDMLTAMLAMVPILLAEHRLEATKMEEVIPQYGLIGQITSQPGKRAELIAILKQGTADMPGNMGYVIGKDSADDNAIWIVEIWATKEDHAASLALPSVQSAIAQGRPLIAGFGHRFEFKPS
ncbi:putative quinol monooxygenase [Sphingorhabdus arenilitoris]|uniref:Quinol monooxygenase n=1 Tax=Sphingorhabdus arenilitoris TaxID=1490041 RepID=A0ABV8RHR7_9SPHN